VASEERIPTNIRMLLILEVVGRTDKPLTPTEINAQLGLPKQTVHRLCSTLEAEGFLTRTPDGKRMKPARRLMDLGTGLVQSNRDHIVRHQVLENIAAHVMEAVNYVIPQETGMHYLDRVDTNWAFRIQLPVGTNVPFHCTASGKAYMASLPPAARRAFVTGLDLKPLTDKTHTNPLSLLEELAETRKRGYALDNEEFMEGMVAIAVPVTDPDGRYVASLATHGPSQRFTIEKAVAERSILVESAERIQQILFD
jgi:DNA-binding IclR family transcriptional regulator